MGTTGMTYGLFLSTRVHDETEAVQSALGSFFPILLLSGVLWPVEGTVLFRNNAHFHFPLRYSSPATVGLVYFPDLLGRCNNAIHHDSWLEHSHAVCVVRPSNHHRLGAFLLSLGCGRYSSS